MARAFPNPEFPLALTPDTSNKAFLREVDEEVRRERIADIWARFGSWIVVGVVALLVAVGAGLWWRSHREAARGVEGEQLQAAFDKLGGGDVKSAAAGLAPIARDGGPGYRTLARMAQADIQLQNHDVAGAARIFGQIAADDGVATPFRDLALVRQTAAEYDTIKPQVVVGRLRTLAVKGQPYFGSAGEMVGLAYLRMNRRDLAGSLFTQIAADETVPASLRQRAVQMASVLAAGAAPAHEEKPAT